MRRSRTAFAWVSMMDLLFGLFGGLLILTVLISAKLGHSSGIEERPFNLVVTTVTATDPLVQAALRRMHVGFELTNTASRYSCSFSAAVPSLACSLGESPQLRDAPVKFATTAEPAPMATLFIGSVSEDLAALSAVVTPVLWDGAVLRDGAQALRGDETVTVRLSVKSGSSFWEPAPFTYTVQKLLEIAEKRPHSDIPLLAELQGGCTPIPSQGNCKVLEVHDGNLVFHP